MGRLREALDRNPKLMRAPVWLAASYAQLDRIEEAREQVRPVLSEHPDSALKQERDWAYSGEAGQRYVEALKKAGLPE